MSTSKNPVVTPLNAGHPLVAIVAAVPQSNANDAAGAAAAASAGVTVTAGAGAPNTQGLTITGIAAVCTAYATYLGTLSALKKAQVGQIQMIVTSTTVALSVHSADVTTFSATLATALNTGGNSGAIGT
jgi:hypothetical protein